MLTLFDILYYNELEAYNMKLKPLADRVVLKQLQAEEKTKSGLFLATSAQEKPEIGRAHV